MTERQSLLTFPSPGPSVEYLLDALFDQTRWRPLLLVTCASDTNKPRVNVDHLREAVGEAAEVHVLSHQQAWTLTEQVPEQFNTYGGALRLVFPSAHRTDPRERHPLFFTWRDTDSEATIRSVVRQLRLHGFDTDEKVVEPAGPVATSKKAERLKDLHKEASNMRAEIARQTRRAEQAEAEISALRKEIRRLSDRIDELTGTPTPVFADLAEQFRHEVGLAWLTGTSEPERDRWRLRDYTIGPDFLASLDLPLVGRARIIDVALDVLTRRAYEMPARRVHPLRINETGNAPQLTRPDGALAWRCDLKTNAPGGARLMWWELTDGTVELGKAAHHDDYTLR